MKRFKVGLVAVVAILAMSFTIASKEAKLLPPAAGCWSTVTLDDPTLVPTTLVASSNAGANTTVPKVQLDPNAFIRISGVDYQITTASHTGFKISDNTGSVNRAAVCLSPFNTFCCYQVQELPAGSGIFKVVAIAYKP